MREISKEQIWKFHAILRQHNLSDDKRSIIKEISGGRTESTTELTWDEANDWIAKMNGITKRSELPDPRQKMINKVIAMAREMGVIKRQPVVSNGGMKTVSDYTDFNKWMREKSYLKKSLNSYSYEELPTLVTQYKNIYESWLRKP
jgi:hypothetical protein